MRLPYKEPHSGSEAYSAACRGTGDPNVATTAAQVADPAQGLPTPTKERDSSLGVIVNREVWLTGAMSGLAAHVFGPVGYDIPRNVRVSCSWPSHGGLARRRRVLGQAWDSSCSRDGHFEIFVSPFVDDATDVLAILAHELVHVVVGIKHGHRGPFRRCARAIGLDGPMRSTVAGAPFKRSIAPVVETLGPYPHGAINPHRNLPANPDGSGTRPKTTGPKPQRGRLRKAVCEECGMTLRLTATWIVGRKLSCPDMDCGGHEYPLQIYR